MFILLSILLCLYLTSCCVSHLQPGIPYVTENMRVQSDFNISICTTFQSYHIHTMFLQNNANSTSAAIRLQESFMKEFGLTYEQSSCEFLPNDPNNLDPSTTMCVFEVQYQPAGPFVTAQTTFFIPKADYEKAVSFTMKQRGLLDVMVHPNTGCGVEDHIIHPVWGGRSHN